MSKEPSAAQRMIADIAPKLVLWIAFRLHSSRNLLPSRFVCIHVVTPLRSTDERDI